MRNYSDPIWTDLPEGMERAKLYPYNAPNYGFLLNNGKIEPIPENLSLLNKIPILAIGSNRAPSQLLRKFGTKETVAVTPAIIRNCDVIYASIISYYGAIPATLWPKAGSEIKLSIIWLNHFQLEIMHDSEAVGKAYDFVEFKEGLVDRKSLFYLDSKVYGYVSRSGALNFSLNTSEIRALSAIRAKRRYLKSVNQAKAIKLVSKIIWGRNKEKDIYMFRKKIISDKIYRIEIINKLRNMGIAPKNTPWTVLHDIKLNSLDFY